MICFSVLPPDIGNNLGGDVLHRKKNLVSRKPSVPVRILHKKVFWWHPHMSRNVHQIRPKIDIIFRISDTTVWFPRSPLDAVNPDNLIIRSRKHFFRVMIS